MAKPLFDAVPATLTIAALISGAFTAPALAQPYPVTPQQRATATQVAQSGVPLSELNPNAPQSHTVQSGDTLWAISSLFLKSAWRWPELWGMNLADIKNPHLIYPGQTLFLETAEGRARLRMRAAADAANATGGDLPTVRVSPRTRVENLAANPLPTIRNQVMESLLAEPLVVGELELLAAPRIVSAQDSRVLLTRGDRAYARGPAGGELKDDPSKKQQEFRVFRNATPLKDPQTGEILGYEAQYIGKALLAQSESTQSSADAEGKASLEIVPATIDISHAKEEMRVGDRLLPEPARVLQNYVPHAPSKPIDARILSIYGSAVINAAQNQVVTINRGSRDGLENGVVLTILKYGSRMIDKTDPSLPQIKLPDEQNGQLMVFRTFERVSYALILDIVSGVKIGDRLVNPN